MYWVSNIVSKLVQKNTNDDLLKYIAVKHWLMGRLDAARLVLRKFNSGEVTENEICPVFHTKLFHDCDVKDFFAVIYKIGVVKNAIFTKLISSNKSFLWPPGLLFMFCSSHLTPQFLPPPGLRWLLPVFVACYHDPRLLSLFVLLQCLVVVSACDVTTAHVCRNLIEISVADPSIVVLDIRLLRKFYSTVV